MAFDMGLRPPNERPINTVFQSYALFPHMTVAGNIAFGLEMRKVPKSEVKERVERTIDLVRLAGMEDRKPRQLSGGQQQRVALARALVNEPQVLLLDEPLGALDLKLREAMQLELRDLQQRVGITFIYVTHDQEEALTMSNRIGVMNHGRLLQVGPPEEIYERPADRFVAGFIGETNFIDGKVVEEGRVSIADGLVVGAVTTSAPGTEVTLSCDRNASRSTARNTRSLPVRCGSKARYGAGSTTATPSITRWTSMPGPWSTPEWRTSAASVVTSRGIGW